MFNIEKKMERQERFIQPKINVICEAFEGNKYSVRDRDGKSLKIFIKGSESRVEMMRAGRRLGNVMNHEKFGREGKYYDNLNTEREERLKEREAKRLEEEKKRKEEEARRMEEWRRHRFSRVRVVPKPVPLSEENLRRINPLMNMRIRKGIERVLQSNRIAGKDLSEFESQALREFYDHTGELSELMQKYLSTRTYDFLMEKEKQEHLDQILAEKYKVVSNFLGEDQLRQFLLEQEEDINKKFNVRRNQKSDNAQEEDAETLELLKFFEKEEEQSATTLKKIIKINQQIRAEILKEEHERKLQQIKDLRMQQNYEVFRLLDELPQGPPMDSKAMFREKRMHNSLPFYKNGFLKRTSGLTSRKEASKKKDPQIDAEENGDALRVASLKSVNPNADPNNPIFLRLFHNNQNNFRLKTPAAGAFQSQSDINSKIDEMLPMYSTMITNVKPYNMMAQTGTSDMFRVGSKPQTSENTKYNKLLSDTTSQENFRNSFYENYIFFKGKNLGGRVNEKKPRKIGASELEDGAIIKPVTSQNNRDLKKWELDHIAWEKREENMSAKLDKDIFVKTTGLVHKEENEETMEKPLYLNRFNKHKYKLKTRKKAQTAENGRRPTIKKQDIGSNGDLESPKGVQYKLFKKMKESPEDYDEGDEDDGDDDEETKRNKRDFYYKNEIPSHFLTQQNSIFNLIDSKDWKNIYE